MIGRCGAAWLTAAFTLAAPVAAHAQDAAIPQLARDPRMHGPVPLPARERDLPTVVAERWFTVPERSTTL